MNISELLTEAAYQKRLAAEVKARYCVGGNSGSKIGNERKFREPTSVTNLRESLPVQYGGAYSIDGVNNGFQEVLKRVNGKT